MQRRCLAVLGTLMLLAAALPAHAGTYNLDSATHPLSSAVTLGIWGGEPSNPEAILLATIGPISVTGTMNADINTPGGNGTITVNSGTINLANYVEVAVPIGELGTVDISAVGVSFTFSGGPYPVAGNVITIPTGTPINVGVPVGAISLQNGTGLLGILLGPEGLTVDFNLEPISEVATFGTDIEIGTTDEGAGLSAPGPEFNLTGILAVPAFDLGGVFLYAALSGDVHLAAPSVIIPEPSTYALASMGLVGLVFAARRRRK